MSARVASEGLACVSDQTASAKLVYKVLEYEGAQSQSELVAETGLSRNAVRCGVELLAECGVLTERRDPTDARRKVYRLAD